MSGDAQLVSRRRHELPVNDSAVRDCTVRATMGAALENHPRPQAECSVFSSWPSPLMSPLSRQALNCGANLTTPAPHVSVETTCAWEMARTSPVLPYLRLHISSSHRKQIDWHQDDRAPGKQHLPTTAHPTGIARPHLPSRQIRRGPKIPGQVTRTFESVSGLWPSGLAPSLPGQRRSRQSRR
jgi:hypothetical protein